MKNITFLLFFGAFFCFPFAIFSQAISTQTFTVSGTDSAPTVLSIDATDITVNQGQPINSITIVNAAGSLTNTNCGTWYTFTLSIDGGAGTLVCAADINGTDVTGFTNLTITSADPPSDGVDDAITITIDLEVDYVPPTCPQPTDLATTEITSTTAALSWTENGPATEWEIEYGTSGFSLGSGTTVNDTDGVPGEAISGLTPNTAYDFYVRSDCGGGDISTWAGPFAFLTSCVPFAAFTENFDGVNIGEIPNCWRDIINSTSSNDVYVSVQASADSQSPPNNLEFYNAGDGAAELFLITPVLTDLPLGTHQMRFFARADNEGILEIGTITNPTDESTFTLVETIETTQTYQEFIVQFDMATTDSYIAFRGTFTGTLLLYQYR